MRIRKAIYVVLVSLVALSMIAADFVGEIPEGLIMLLTVVVMPGVVGLAKAASEKWPDKLGWLGGKFWLSILTYAIAIVLTAAFVTWGELLNLPQDPGLAVPFLVACVEAFFGSATGLYNILIAPIHNRIRESG